MKTITILKLHCILLLHLVVPVSSVQTHQKRGRRRRGASVSKAGNLYKSNHFDETLRDKWVDILSLEHESTNAVRLDTRRDHYRYEAEILADQLLGLKPIKGSFIKNKPLFLPWTYSFPLATAVAICFFALPVSQILSRVGIFMASTYSSITPYLMPTWSIIRSTTGNYLRQGQAILHSMPYFLRHLNRIKINPMALAYKILKKCIILECWRHIWVRVYKLSSYMWKGTKSNVHSAYIRVVPAFIRRGIKSMFQSMIQGQVHGVMGGLVGTFWQSTTVSPPVDTDGIVQELSESIAADSLAAAEDSVESALEATAESVVEEMGDAIEAAAIDSAIDSAVDSVVEDGLLDSIDSSVIENAIESVVEDGLLDSIDSSAIENAVESVIEDGMFDSIDSSAIESAVEAIVEDCLDGDCIDTALDSILDE